MTEWEQLKKEYKEIPIPAEGPHQVLEAMAKAKQKRSRWKTTVKYSAMAAAAVLVVVLVPGVLLSGGFGAKMNDCAAESVQESYYDGAAVKDAIRNDTSGSSTATAENATKSEATMESIEDNMASVETEVPWAEMRVAISQEILRQMEERGMLSEGTSYTRSELYPEGFEELEETQEYYFNEEGLLVIVFAPGEVAPGEQGTVEFVIPADVFSLQN